jgi:hypothetical protein
VGGVLAGSFLACATAFAALDRPAFDCHAYAERQAELRHLPKKDRIETERSCGVSKLYTLESEADAQAVADRLNESKKRMCITPAYVANDGSTRITFCPQL